MNHARHLLGRMRTAGVVLWFASLVGCGSSSPITNQPVPAFPQITGEKFFQALEQPSTTQATPATPKPVFQLPAPAGWTRSGIMTLAKEDHGFVVVYSHPSDVTLAFYQYTRGMKKIPADLGSDPVQREMKRAKKEVRRAMQPFCSSAVAELDGGWITVGKSGPPQACWVWYGAWDAKFRCDVYVWAEGNTFFKVQSISMSDRSKRPKALETLLDSIATASRSIGDGAK